MSRQGYHRRRPWKGGGRAACKFPLRAPEQLRQLLHSASLPQLPALGSLRSRRPNQSPGLRELEPGGKHFRTHPPRSVRRNAALRGAAEMEPVRSRAGLTETRCRRWASCERLRGASAGEGSGLLSAGECVSSHKRQVPGRLCLPPPGGLERTQRLG